MLTVRKEAQLTQYLSEPVIGRQLTQYLSEPVIGRQLTQYLSEPVIGRQLTQYLSEPVIGRMENPATWRRQNKERRPDLARLPRGYLGPPPASVPSERLFSVAGEVISDHRSALYCQTVQHD